MGGSHDTASQPDTVVGSTTRPSWHDDAPDKVGERIAGRYWVEDILGSGGMAAVYRVVDESSGQRVAIKRLRQRRLDDERSLSLFRSEFQILSTLRHPRIIEAYDYGIDHKGPFYTMELLDGLDMRALAPMPFSQVCRYLRDIASSLALLHSRSLIHRDISPRNVRATPEGHAKLIDFGSITPFGVPGEVVGTPPCVPPEAFGQQGMDGRADLYSLGVLAYLMLTGNYPFPARSLRELPSAWKRPPAPPSDVSSDIPPELDQLVLSLLRSNPLARPATAAEVIDRLNAVARLEPDSAVLTAESYVHSHAFVGREAERQRLERALDEALEGRGNALVVESAAGMGRTRLVAEVGLSARLKGAIVVQVDGALHREPYSFLRALGAGVLDAAPKNAALAARDDASVLGGLAPELRRRLGNPEAAPIPKSPGEWRGRILGAMTDWLLRLTETTPLVILADDLDQSPEDAASLLASLIAPLNKHHLLVVATMRADRERDAAAEAVLSLSDHMSLPGLSPSETTELVQGVFGTVPSSERLAAELHALTEGSPLLCMEYLRHLVRADKARYADGAWVLPEAITDADVPSSVEQAWDARVERLDPVARDVAESLSVCRHPIPPALARALSRHEDRDLEHRLSTLQEHGVIVRAGDAIHFASEPMRAALLKRVEPKRRVMLHGLAGRFLERTVADDPTAAHEAGWHLMHGGAEEEGAQLLSHMAINVWTQEMRTRSDQVRDALPALEMAFVVLQERGRKNSEMLPLAYALAISGYYVDYAVVGRHEAAIVEVLERGVGISVARRLRPRLGAKVSLLVGVLWAYCMYLWTPRRLRFPTFADNVRALFRSVACLVGVATICFDSQRIDRFAASLKPVADVFKDRVAGAITQAAVAVRAMCDGREAEAVASCRALIKRGEDPNDLEDLTDEYRQAWVGSLYYAVGALECFRDGTAGLACADRLEQFGWEYFDLVADQIRTLYYALRGDYTKSEHFRRQGELRAIRTGTSWQLGVWVPVSMIPAYMRLGDRIGLKRTAEQLERMSRTIPSLVTHTELARAAYLEVHGTVEEARHLVEHILATRKPRAYIGWASAMGYQARQLNAKGDHEAARRLCVEAQEEMSPADREFISLYQAVEIEFALAEAGLGRIDAAKQQLDEQIDVHRAGGNPVTLGAIHTALAHVALTAEDTTAFHKQLVHLWEWYGPTGHPALLAKYEELKAEGEKAFGVPAEATEGTETEERLFDQLLSCEYGDARERLGLDLFLQRVGAESGYLFLLEDGGFRLGATRNATPPPDALYAAVELQARAFDDETQTGTAGTDSHLSDSDYVIWLLVGPARGCPALVGAVALPTEPPKEPSSALLLALSRGLQLEPLRQSS